jgi:hypothetical protein
MVSFLMVVKFPDLKGSACALLEPRIEDERHGRQDLQQHDPNELISKA